MRAEKDIEGSSYSRHCHTMSVGGIHRCLPTLLDKEMEINYFLKALHRHSYFYFTSLSFSLVVQSTPMLLLAVEDIGISHICPTLGLIKGGEGKRFWWIDWGICGFASERITDYGLWIACSVFALFAIRPLPYVSRAVRLRRWEKAKRPLLTDRPWLMSNSSVML